MTTPRLSGFLRVRLPPPRFTVSSPPPSLGSYTKISADQVLACAHFSVPVHWSIAPDLCERLIDAASLDLDSLLLQHLNLTPGLTAVVADLVRQWDRNFGATPREDHSKGLETATNEASRLLLLAVMDAFEVIQSSTNTTSDPMQSERQHSPPHVRECIIDNSLKRPSVSVGKPYTVGVEDKRPIGFPSVLAELSRRASCGVLDTEINAVSHQPKWWIVANKGALYTGAYDVNWVVFAGLTGFCVGHRSGLHMFWSGPFHNRRDEDDEFTTATPDPAATLSHAFGNEPHPTVPQTGLLLLFLAVALRGANDKGSPWVQGIFPRLCALSFTPPSPARQPHPEFTHTGREITNADESDDSASSSNDSGDNYTSSSGSERSLAPTPLLSGRHRFTGKWYGDLRHTEGYAVKILDSIASGYQASVYAGELLQKGRAVSAVAVKVSNDSDALMAEFRRYLALQKLMGDSIPRCYGLCVVWNTACLVTSLVPNHAPSRKLSKAERGAVYAALRRMHEAGWTHNDVVDDGSLSPRNLLWNPEGRPVLIDLVTATRHTCKEGCSELMRLQRALKLTNHDITIWAR
ncbi:hypothetical protein GGX14DRAFT_564241 [Mycena pura]|uniref:Protein kinase domain-containing protein n=1 Tax=Mycena pura TaxID=153505 RepID=A0AAD6VKN8_9AGAR|nr:hypothetical protein GGX14DRAFT_564241 [Mycena pura]